MEKIAKNISKTKMADYFLLSIRQRHFFLVKIFHQYFDADISNQKLSYHSDEHPILLASKFCSGSDLRLVAYIASHNKNNLETRDNSGATPLLVALREGHLPVAELLIDNGADVTAMDEAGCTTLMYAAQHGFDRLMRLFIQRNVNVDSQDIMGETALMKAVKNKAVQLSSVKLLLAHGAKALLTDYKKFTAITYAIQKGNEEVALLLLNLLKSTSNLDVNSTDIFGNSLLIHAASMGSIRLVEFLLNQGAKLDQANYRNETAIMKALESQHLGVLHYLVNGGANINCCSRQKSFLVTLAKFKRWEMLQKSLNAGADPNLYDEDGSTLLGELISAKQWELFTLAIEKGAHVNGPRIDARNRIGGKGYTPLMLCVFNDVKGDSTNYMEHLLEKGADRNQLDYSGDTALIHACKTGRYVLAKKMIDKLGFDPNFIALSGNLLTVLFNSKIVHNIDFLNFLIGKLDVQSELPESGETTLFDENLLIGAFNTANLSLIHFSMSELRKYLDGGNQLIIKNPLGTVAHSMLKLKDSAFDINFFKGVVLSHMSCPDGGNLSENQKIYVQDLFFRTISNSKIDAGRWLLAQYASHIKLDEEDKVSAILFDNLEGEYSLPHFLSPLGHAVMTNNKSFVSLLIENGADVAKVSEEYEVSLPMIAARYASWEIIELIIDEISKKNGRPKSDIINQRSKNELTALMYFAHRGYQNPHSTQEGCKILDKFLEMGTDIHAVDADAHSIIHRFAEHQPWHIISHLLETLQKRKIKLFDTELGALLSRAEKEANYQYYLEVLKYHFNLSASTGMEEDISYVQSIPHGYIPCALLAKIGNWELLKKILNEIKDDEACRECINSDRNFYEFSLPILAAQAKNLEMLEYLVSKGGDLTASNRSGVSTALSTAVVADIDGDNLHMVEYIIQKIVEKEERLDLDRLFDSLNACMANAKILEKIIHTFAKNKNSYQFSGSCVLKTLGSRKSDIALLLISHFGEQIKPEHVQEIIAKSAKSPASSLPLIKKLIMKLKKAPPDSQQKPAVSGGVSLLNVFAPVKNLYFIHSFFKDYESLTPLMAAVHRPDLVAFLLFHGADPKIANEDSREPIWYAARVFYSDTIIIIYRYLLEHNIPISIFDRALYMTATNYQISKEEREGFFLQFIKIFEEEADKVKNLNMESFSAVVIDLFNTVQKNNNVNDPFFVRLEKFAAEHGISPEYCEPHKAKRSKI